jgi:hypothetical protein
MPHSEVIKRNQRERKLDQRDTDPYYSFNSTLEVGGLYQGYGTHYVDLWIGTPPQRQTVIVDTGSGITAFPCSGCANCGADYHVDQFFQEDQSSTFQKFGCNQCVGARCSNSGGANEYCHLSVSYQEGSMWNAFEGSDKTYVGGKHDRSVKAGSDEGNELHGLIHGEDPLNAADFEFNMVFGCQTRITGLFKTQLADGIMGMCLKSSSIFNQMYDQKIIDTPSFSLCFARAIDAKKEGSVAGALTMGGTDTRLHRTPMIYAQGFKTKGVMHGVSIRKIYLMEADNYAAGDATVDNTHKIDISTNVLNSGSIIVDSGTTDTYMTRSLRAPFQEMFKKVVGFAYNEKGMKLTNEQILKIPTILIQIKGNSDHNGELSPDTAGLAGAIDDEFPYDILIAVTPAHYVEYDSDSKKYVGRFSMTEGSGSVLGANTIRGHDVYFDIPENSRIGFAESACDYKTLIGEIEDDEQVEVAGNGKEEEEDEEKEKEKPKNDDYYDDDEDLGFESNASTANSQSQHTNKVVAAGVLVVVVAIVAVYKRKSGSKGYSQTQLSGDHLNDLHLDTEIQNIPAIA